MLAMNTLYYGDNLDVLRRHIKDETVDLVYLDPPFNSNQDYNILFAEQNGSQSAAQIKAFEDTWRWDSAAASAYHDVVEQGGKISEAMQAFRRFLGDNDMLAYLAMMAPRLKELNRVLKPTGSMYLHCDPTASHYLKLLMDAVFGKTAFRNEIVWHYRKWPSGHRQFQRNHDIILFYAKTNSEARPFHMQYMERTASTIKRFGKAKIRSGYDAEGKRLPSQTDEEESAGVPLDDVWNIGRVPPIKQLFPTQKPEPLLARIIECSTNPGETVLDPFCGCGTTIVEAQRLKRSWVGIDITHLAITLIKHRLIADFGSSVQFKVIGEPVSLPDAQALAIADPYQFQWWALGLVGARPVDQKKGPDQGIDGKLYFHDDPKGRTKQIVISVKSGELFARDVRDLIGVMSREEATIGALLTLHPPTRAMRRDAASMGFYQAPWGNKCARLQILTVAELLEGKKLDFPRQNVTFKKTSQPNSRSSTSVNFLF